MGIIVVSLTCTAYQWGSLIVLCHNFAGTGRGPVPTLAAYQRGYLIVGKIELI